MEIIMRHKHLLQTLAVIALAGLFWVVVTTRSWGESVEWTSSYSPNSAVDGQPWSAGGDCGQWARARRRAA